jgi:hypothetical protein
MPQIDPNGHLTTGHRNGACRSGGSSAAAETLKPAACQLNPTGRSSARGTSNSRLPDAGAQFASCRDPKADVVGAVRWIRDRRHRLLRREAVRAGNFP